MNNELSLGEQKQSLVYGPVTSRRFGTTIGIGLVPLKVCSFDCVFCELSVHTNVHTLERKTYVSVEEVLSELRKFPTQEADYLALSGAGEPSLAANMGEVIDALHAKYETPVIVLSNGSTIYMKDVQDELRRAEAVKLTFSTMDEQAFKRLNQPVEGLTAKKVADGIEQFASDYEGKLYFEVVVVKGINDELSDVRRTVEFLSRFNPYHIDINRPVRPGTARYLELPDRAVYEPLTGEFSALRVF
ncbi:radical SAM protein [Coprothermobacter platensis]|uniref:radical SAM protein n=1 Tax=Coprothermobacter platensis TaxID=108819 RepID=UPI00035D764E|nr:radical SAM protein [Coprothermobacter platensis]